MNPRFAAVLMAVCVIILGFATATQVHLFKHIEKRGPAPERVMAILPGDLNATAGRIEAIFNRWSEFERPGRSESFPNKFSQDSLWSRFFL